MRGFNRVEACVLRAGRQVYGCQCRGVRVAGLRGMEAVGRFGQACEQIGEVFTGLQPRRWQDPTSA